MMFALLTKLGSVSGRLVAFVLVLWLAGLGCMIGCEMSVTAAPEVEPQITSEAESCPATSSHDCCKNDIADDAVSITRQKHTTHMSCCPLTDVSSDSARKISTTTEMRAVADSGFLVGLNSGTSSPHPAYHVRVPDRGSTHLRYCVFLI